MTTLHPASDKVFYIGLMSGTSLDGVDAVLASFDSQGCQLIQTVFHPYPESLRQDFLVLHLPQANELEHSVLTANRLTRLYADTINTLLKLIDEPTKKQIRAIGCHGQTIRHRPELGFTLQLNNPALLAELTQITVVADFRSRDIAAGGQGAPLVPAFHQAVFSHPDIHRVIVNIGGISNLTDLHPASPITGFDCGPGNLLMDAWCQRHTGKTYDHDGAWAASGRVIETLLTNLMAHPFFRLCPPKSTGRDTFNMAWLEQHIAADQAPEDIQATLLEITARSIAESISQNCRNVEESYICGGGARNSALVARLRALLPQVHLSLTDELGIPVDWVEAMAFAWLAKQAIEEKPGNLPAVTGAAGKRILGGIYPA